VAMELVMDADRKFWNEQQQLLQDALAHPADHLEAIDLFLRQHAMVHASVVGSSSGWSFDDEVWQDITPEAARRIPASGDHSIAWAIWHIARIEDVTMNLLVAGTPQLFHRDGWQVRLKIAACDTGNAMSPDGIAVLSAAIDLEALRAYRVAVGRQTREIVQALTPADLKRKVDPARIQRVKDEGAVVAAASEITDYWSKRTLAGLLLMPPTRHNFLHLNEALRIKQRRR
jgi:hypothetical protein